MWSLRYTIFFVFIYCSNAQNYINFLTNYIRNTYHHKRIVTEFSCDTHETVNQLKELAVRDYQISILQNGYDQINFPRVPNHQIYVAKLECDHFIRLMEKVNDIRLFAAPISWIIYYKASNINETTIADIFGKLNLLVDSDVNILELKENGTVIVRKIFKKQRNLPLIVENAGTQYNNGVLVMGANFDQFTVRRRKTLSVTLTSCIVVTHNDSLKHLTDKRDKHIDSIAKVNYVLVQHLADFCNVSLKYSVRSTWGYKNQKLEWTGMIGELVNHRADIGGTALFFTKDRVDIIDYLSMTTPTRSKFVFRQPKLSYVSNVYSLPFNKDVWIASGTLLVFTGCILYGITKWEWSKSKHNLESTSVNTELQPSILDVFLLTFSAICQQGSATTPTNTPGRIAVIFLYISFMFLYTSYSANIVALLQSSSTSIHTLEDLLKSRIDVGVEDTVYNRHYFPHAQDPIRNMFYKQKVAPPGRKNTFIPLDEGVARIQRGLYAFNMELGSGYKLMSETFQEDEKCGLQEIAFLQVLDPWLAIQKNSSYREILKIGLRLIRESGLQSREHSLIYTRKPVCTTKSGTFVSVGIVDCYPAAAILASGIIFAMAILVFELYIHRRLSHRH